MTEEENRFWRKVRKGAPSECWLWMGSLNEKGYGSFVFNGRSQGAHRFVVRDKLRPGLIACHHCDNPTCVNPAHVYAGTHKQNNMDMVLRGRLPNAKINADKALVIRAAPPVWGAAQALALHFGISRQNVRMIISGRAWMYIGEPSIKDCIESARIVTKFLETYQGDSRAMGAYHEIVKPKRKTYELRIQS